MKDRHSIDVRTAARLARDDEPRPDDGPSRAELNAELERDRLEQAHGARRGRPPFKPLTWDDLNRENERP